MNKSELAAQLAKDSGLTQAHAAGAIDLVLNGITKALKSGEDVSIVGFGSFSVAERAARKGRNPQTGEEIKIAAARLPKFKPGKGLKDAVAKKPKKKKK